MDAAIFDGSARRRKEKKGLWLSSKKEKKKVGRGEREEERVDGKRKERTGREKTG